MTILSTIGVLLGVGTLVVVLAVMSGFVKEVREASRGGLSDVIIEADIAGFAYYDELAELVRQHPNVIHATPVIQLFGLARITADPTTPYPGATTTRVCLILGIRPDDFSRVSRFREYMIQPIPEGPLGQIGAAVVGRDDVDRDRSGLSGNGNRPVQPEAGVHSAVPSFTIDDATVLRIFRRLQRISPSWSDRNVLTLFRSTVGAGPEVGVPELLARMRTFIEDRQDGEIPPGAIPGIALVSYDAPAVARQVDPNAAEKPVLLSDVGSEIVLTTLPITASGDLAGTGRAVSPQMAAFTIVNHFQSRLYEFDRQNVYIPFAEAQRLGRLGESPTEFGMMHPPRAHQLLVALKDYDQAAESIADFRRIYANLRPDDPFKNTYMTFSTWEQKQAMILSVVTMQRNLMVVLLGLIILVAGFLIGATLSMIVKEKTRDIGILKSLGGSDGGVASIFLLYGFTVGAVGSSLGLVAGLLFVENIDAVAERLSTFLGYSVFPAAAYGFDRIPRDVDPVATATVAIGAIVIAVACSTVAAWRASRMQPVEALRYE